MAELGGDEQQQQQQQQQQGSAEAGCSSRDASPEIEASAVPPSSGKPPVLKLAAGDGRSPSGSPGIQAVHAPDAAAEPAAAGAGSEPSPSPQRASEAPSPQRGRDAFSVEPASLPSSPFASAVAQGRRSSSHSSDAGAAPAAAPPLPALPQLRVAVELPAPAPDAAAAARGRLSTEGDGSEDVYARFGSYDEMVAYFRQLAAEGQGAPGTAGDAGSQPGSATAAAAAARGALASAGVSRAGSLARADLAEISVTAASSFSGAYGGAGEGTAWRGGGASCAAASAHVCTTHHLAALARPGPAA